MACVLARLLNGRGRLRGGCLWSVLMILGRRMSVGLRFWIGRSSLVRLVMLFMLIGLLVLLMVRLIILIILVGQGPCIRIRRSRRVCVRVLMMVVMLLLIIGRRG